MIWFLNTVLPLQTRCWDDECIVYDADTGHTHLITPLASDILLCLQQAPSDIVVLVKTIANRFDFPSTADCEAALIAVLQQLLDIQLVARSPV